MITVGLKRVDRGAVRTAVEAWAAVVGARPEVNRIVWYGSFISGAPTPRSDADLCVVVRGELAPAVARLPRHARGAEYLPASATPVPFDVAVLTVAEYEGLAGWAPEWTRAIGRGELMFDRGGRAPTG